MADGLLGSPVDVGEIAHTPNSRPNLSYESTLSESNCHQKQTDAT